jgi:hypothetical protein
MMRLLICSVLQPPVTACLLGPNILLSSICILLSGRGTTFHTYTKQHRRGMQEDVFRLLHTKVKSPQLVGRMSIPLSSKQQHGAGQFAGCMAVQRPWTRFSSDAGPQFGNCIKFTRTKVLI